MILVAVGLITLTGLGVSLLAPKEEIPRAVKAQLSFPLYYPKGDLTPFKVDPNSIKVIPNPQDSSQKVLSLLLVSKDNKVTISEQVTPDLVSEQVGLDKLASLMQAYKEIITSVGRVELTRPKELKGAQTAVADPNFTTLIFARPDNDLSEDEWRRIFNSFEVVR